MNEGMRGERPGEPTHTESLHETESIMRTKATSYASSVIAWLREVWNEMDYAQRRLIELQTTLPSPMMPRPREVDELEDLYALPSREPD